MYALPMDQLYALIAVQLQEGGRASLTVTGYSMEPMLRHRRDSVELIPISGYGKRGDVILYRRENGDYILHRVIRADGENYICCGDNQYMREKVSHRQLLAVVDGFTRKGKRYTLSHAGYRLYTALWVGLFPLRGAYITLRRILGRLCKKIHK